MCNHGPVMDCDLLFNLVEIPNKKSAWNFPVEITALLQWRFSVGRLLYNTHRNRCSASAYFSYVVKEENGKWTGNSNPIYLNGQIFSNNSVKCTLNWKWCTSVNPVEFWRSCYGFDHLAILQTVNSEFHTENMMPDVSSHWVFEC